MEKQCTFCNLPLKGRTDKKFCDDTCRISYHNNLRNHGFYVKWVNRSLSKNRRILKKIMELGMKSVPMNVLEYYGFSMNGLTGIESGEEGRFHFRCYEYLLVPEGTKYVISESEDVYQTVEPAEEINNSNR